jgi:hypothetical protein
VLAGISDQSRIGLDREEKEGVPKPAILAGEDGRGERRQVIGQVGEITRTVVELAADDQESVVPCRFRAGPRPLLAVQNFIARDHRASLLNDHPHEATDQVVKKVNSIIA